MSSLIIVCGKPGAGKTSYARRLIERSPAVLLDIDTCTELLVRVGLSQSGRDSNDRDSEYFKSHYRDAIYATLFGIARENLSSSNVVVVGPFSKEILQPEWPENLGRQFKTEVAVHYIYCQPDIRRARLIERNESRDASKLQCWDGHLAYYQDEKRPAFQHIFVRHEQIRPTLESNNSIL